MQPPLADCKEKFDMSSQTFNVLYAFQIVWKGHQNHTDYP